MKKIKLKDGVKKIHFIGAGGISMSSLAEVLSKSGYSVTGSDRQGSKAIDDLNEMGVNVTPFHSAENIKDDLDLVVYTVAVKPDNEEMKAARAKGIKIIDRAEMLGIVMSNYENPICISGTHGKTTTTSMIAEILLTAEMDPSISVGGYYKNTNGKFGDSEYFVVESCEYFNSFHKFFPRFGVVLNVEEDHLDFFKDIEEIKTSFNRFAKNISGVLVINSDIKDLESITKDVTAKILTYGESGDYTARNISYSDQGTADYELFFKDKFVSKISTGVPGYHNVLNSMAAFALCKELKIPDDIIIKGINNYKGTDRRFQMKGNFNGAAVVDDYAHHPTEISATLKSAKNFKAKRTVVVFQPHTYTRTKALFTELVDSLSLADEILIVDIFAAREKDTGEIHSKDVSKALSEKGANVNYYPDFDSAVSYLKKNLFPDDLLITMGAGDVYRVGEKLLS